MLLTLSLTAAEGKPEISDKVSKHLGDRILAVPQGATEVEVYRLVKGDGAKSLGFVGYETPDKAKVEGKELLRRLVTIFSEDATYFNGDSKGCALGVGFRFRNDKKETLDIRCCLIKGNIIMVLHNADGKGVLEKDCRGFRNDRDAKVRAIAAELFPDDKCNGSA